MASLAVWNNEKVMYDNKEVGRITQVRKSNRKYDYELEWNKDFRKEAKVTGGKFTNQKKAVEAAMSKIRSSERFGGLKENTEYCGPYLVEGAYKPDSKVQQLLLSLKNKTKIERRKLIDKWRREKKIQGSTYERMLDRALGVAT